MSEHSPRTLRVAEVVRETPDAVSVVFDGDPLPYRPGQFLTLRIPSDLRPTARCYSLSSSPFTDDRMKVTVKRTAGGFGSSWVCDSVTPGTEIEVLPPSGHFSPKDLSRDLLLYAGGSGITPVMSIVKSALSQGAGRLVLVYANRDEASVIFAAELAELSRQHPDRLVVHHWLESVSGIPSPEQLRELGRPHVGGSGAYDVFVCGPAPYMSAVERAMAELGVPRGAVHVERFVSLEGDPWSQPEVLPPADGPTATVHVLLDGATHEVSWPVGSRLLDVLLDQGLDAPYSCREGNCSACGCKLVEGEVSMVSNNVLEQQDLDEGWVLACQSLPVSDVVRVSYDD